MKSESSALRSRRIAATALTSLCREMDLGTQVIHFASDDDAAWICETQENIRFLRNDRTVAEVEIDTDPDYGFICDVVVPDIYQLIRKPAEFDPYAHGIDVCTERSIFGDKLRPDIEATVTVEDSPAFDVPQQLVPTNVMGRKPKVISGMGSK